MEETVALDSKKQKSFLKSIKGIKKLIKKNEGKPVVQKKEEKVEQPPKPFSMKLNGSPVQHKKRKERGLVYLSHIPHGFYEHQMTQYFKQFGVVTNARVIKSKKTGNSKGCAFVEFKEPAVGQIVAETMNNYLMGKRLIKAVYIPPEKQKLKAFRKHWNAVNNPSTQARLKMKKIINTDKDEKDDFRKARKLLSGLTKTKKRLRRMGIDYDFFTPVDVPELLKDNLVQEEVKIETQPPKAKASKKGKVEKVEDKKVKTKNEPNTVVPKKGQAAPAPPPPTKPKELKARRASVMEEFIQIKETDSDSDEEFDSDAFEKEINEEFDDSDGDDDASDDDDDASEDDNDESEEEKVPEKQIILEKVQKKVKLSPVKPNKKAQKVPVQKPQKKNQPRNQPQEVELKRKATQKPAVATKKPKFEKQHQKQTKKSFKKK
ncbi:unnamed protein product [Chrysodeixis includens]|uniref:RRM domain-containing protein n=1 Tax=Chrysodeixis includens TaxID=689277 RepID=A0A9P0C159_CHRIL|nr:unnamed protein product [Chrysodeixis includens]